MYADKYMCFICNNNKDDNVWTTIIYVFVLYIYSGAIGVGFYGNEDTHKGVMQFASAGEDADDTIRYMQNQVSTYMFLDHSNIEIMCIDRPICTEWENGYRVVEWLFLEAVETAHPNLTFVVFLICSLDTITLSCVTIQAWARPPTSYGISFRYFKMRPKQTLRLAKFAFGPVLSCRI